MLYSLRRAAARLLPLAFLAALSGCQTVAHKPKPAAALAPVATDTFTLHKGDTVVGHLQVTHAHEADTLLDIARRFNIGYDDIVRANPGVDIWLPHKGTRVVLPTLFVLPDAPHRGVVVNLAALRLYYYPPAKKGEPQTVITHPISIGRAGWQTPMGKTRIVLKRANPVWHPPLSIRREHAKDGDILPLKIEPGPDDPLGHYAFSLGWPGYLLHGTNQPFGVGLRTSHGCMRMYPEDIKQLFKMIPVGTPVTVVYQPLVFGYRGDTLYMQSYPVFKDYAAQEKKADAGSLLARGEAMAIAKAAEKNLPFDKTLVDAMIKDPRGIALPVSQPRMTLQRFIAAAMHVENRLPAHATWNGVD